MEESDLHTLLIYERTYFEILEEFFSETTGCSYDKFCIPSELIFRIRELGNSFINDPQRRAASVRSFEALADNLGRLYEQEGIECFRAAKNIKCCKVNLGGSSRFYLTQLNAIRRTILISDMALIPDPVMPWLEAEREDEMFAGVDIIQAVYYLLHLKYLLSQESEIPPFLVFPSWEKSLDENDTKTQNSTMQLIADFFSCYVNRDILSFDDVFNYVDGNEEHFLSCVDDKSLFISSGGEVGESLNDALKRYIEDAKLWRTPGFNETLAQASNGRIVLNGIIERIQPQYHLFENANELNSNPLLCVSAQAHYFSLLSQMDNSRVAKFTKADDYLQAATSALTNKRLDYLANIRDEQLIQLRKSDENINFRNKLREFIAHLPKCNIADLGYAAAEVCSYVEALVSSHQREVEGLNGKYEAKHKQTALIAGGGLAVSLVPALAPFLGTALPFAMAAGGKYTADKLSKAHEEKVLSSSMVGIFALAKETSKNK